jgi:glutamine amidotransferase
MIAIIDYGAGNLRSVSNAIDHLGYRAAVTADPGEIWQSQAVVFPGVGAAGDTMTNLKRLGLDKVLLKLAREGRPLLGICLGLQVLLSGSEEGGWQPCLDILTGRVKKLPEGQKIPHMGWNQVRQTQPHPIFEGIPQGANFYFVHSYYAEPQDRSSVVGVTEYGLEFCSVLARGRLVATQFHPEKSGDLGLRIYDNFLRQAGVKKEC